MWRLRRGSSVCDVSGRHPEGISYLTPTAVRRLFAAVFLESSAVVECGAGPVRGGRAVIPPS